MTPENEFPRPFDVRQCDGKQVDLIANEGERAALSRRFGIVRIDRLEADLVLSRRDRDVEVKGTLEADIVQPCAVSAEDLPVSIRETISFRFVPEAEHRVPDEEIELDADACDEIEYNGSHFDLGEAVAQSVGLAIDPFATGPDADRARQLPELSGQEKESPFAALKGLNLK